MIDRELDLHFVAVSFMLERESCMKLLFISLGCDKNLVDAECMLGMLAEDGALGSEKLELTDDECEADVIIVNTCCFIGDAKEESINTILAMAEHLSLIHI